MCKSYTAQQVRFKVDCGACGNLIPLSVFKSLHPNATAGQLAKSVQQGIQLKDYNGNQIEQLGTCSLQVRFSSRKVPLRQGKFMFFVVPDGRRPLLGSLTGLALGCISNNCDQVTSKGISQQGSQGSSQPAVASAGQAEQPEVNTTGDSSDARDNPALWMKTKVRLCQLCHKGGKSTCRHKHKQTFTKISPSQELQQMMTDMDKADRDSAQVKASVLQGTGSLDAYFEGPDAEAEKQQAAAFKKQMLSEFADVFQGVGNLDETVDIHLKQNAEASQLPTRRVAYSLQAPFKAELDRLVTQGILAPLAPGEKSEWCNSFVLVRKPNGTLRICLDPTKLNQQIIRPVHPIKKLDDVLPKLHGARYFSLLDAKCGYWILSLTEQSSYYTTFSTMFGRYRWLKLPFGLSCAGDLFQAHLDKIFSDLPGLCSIADDMLIYGHNPAGRDHDETVRQVLQRARDTGVKFNPEKCVFRATKLPFFGQVITRTGQRPDPAKVRAIQNHPVPQGKEELASFLGMTTYLSKFIPNLADTAKPLRELVSPKNEFVWFAHHDTLFQRLKDMISEDAKSTLL